MNADIFFVLDLSNSVGLEDFEKMKRFQSRFVEKLRIGNEHNRVGTITFKGRANTTFNLDDYTDKNSLLDAIKAIKHNQLGLTNIQDALCHLDKGFNEHHDGARPFHAVFRIGILMTDGVENQYENECDFKSSVEAARDIRKRHSLLLYVIGVTDKVNSTDLKEIATPNGYKHIDNFDDLPLAEEALTHEMCSRGKILIATSSLPSARMRSEGTVVGSVCVSVT